MHQALLILEKHIGYELAKGLSANGYNWFQLTASLRAAACAVCARALSWFPAKF